MVSSHILRCFALLLTATACLPAAELISVPGASAPVLQFSAKPDAREIAEAPIFMEPLVTMDHPVSAGEETALATALKTFSHRTDRESALELETFLKTYPNSSWRLALLANLGRLQYKQGYLSKALETWESAWQAGRDETRPEARRLADHVAGELARMNARIGRADRLELLFKELGQREVIGSATELLTGAREGLWLMRNRPEDAFRCGPMAVATLQRTVGLPLDRSTDSLKSSPAGTSLAQVATLARAVGLDWQIAKRRPGAPVVIPALLHWKVGHFAALTRKSDDLYAVEDPTFGEDLMISAAALDAEASGYFLVPSGPLPRGWTKVDEKEADKVWGKGNTGSSDPDETSCGDEKSGGDKGKCGGMAGYSIHSLLVSLNIIDTPFFYRPAVGPEVEFTLRYNQRDANQPANFSYSNFGPKWTCDWISFVVDDPTVSNPTSLKTYNGGGGAYVVKYQNGNPISLPFFKLGFTLTRPVSGPTTYTRTYPNGPREVFAKVQSVSATERRVFLTERIDAAGNKLTFSYDAQFRLTSVTDALGKVTTLGYPNGFAKNITSVSCGDRSATLTYDPQGRLETITDTVGIVSSFIYAGNSDFIQSLTTPYGTTTFAYGDIANGGATHNRTRWLEATDPLGAKERVEFTETPTGILAADPDPIVPDEVMFTRNSFLTARNSFYWSKKAMAEFPGDYTKARNYHWLHSADMQKAVGVLESFKEPLENRVWYNYPGQPQNTEGATVLGTLSVPTKVGRVLDDGSNQLVQYEYNTFGNITSMIDGAGRETAYRYDVAGLNLTAIEQKNGANYETLAQFLNYNAMRLPETIMNTAGRITTLTYTAQGQPQTITHTRNGVAETTTYVYGPTAGQNDYRQLKEVRGPANELLAAYTYDSWGRIATATDSAAYTVGYTYDALDRVTKVTYPDGTYDEVYFKHLDVEWTRDRELRWTQRLYDPLRRPVLERDPAGRVTRWEWCACGTLEALIDGEERQTTWLYDLQSRMTHKVFADQSATRYVYENTTSRLKAIEDGTGQRKNFTYHIDGRIAGVSYTDLAGAALVPPTPGVNFGYDPQYPRLASRTDGTGTTSYAYHPVVPGDPVEGDGQLASVDGPLAGTVDAVSYTYDELGRDVGRTAAGDSASVVFDALGRVSQTSNSLGVFSHAYLGASGLLDYVDAPNGLRADYDYHPATGDLRLKQIKNTTASGSTLISQHDYTYSAMGNLLTWAQAWPNSNPRQYNLASDGADQLLSATLAEVGVGGAVLRQYHYGYDEAGNRVREQIDRSVTSTPVNQLNQLTVRSAGGLMTFSGTLNEPGTVTIGGVTAAVDAANRFTGTALVAPGQTSVPLVATDVNQNVTSKQIQLAVDTLQGGQTFEYDPNGNLLGDGECIYRWDAENRLIGLTDGMVHFTWTYNGVGQRVAERINGVLVKQWAWDRYEIVAELDGAGMVVKRFYSEGVVHGAALPAAAVDRFYYTSDHLGSVREVLDGNGALQARNDYDPYGRRTRLEGAYEADIGYTGHYHHAATGLLLTYYRQYRTDLGRWLSRDPIEEDDGLNLYAYVQNAPVDFFDELGLQGRPTRGVGRGSPFQLRSMRPLRARIGQGLTSRSCLMKQHGGKEHWDRILQIYQAMVRNGWRDIRVNQQQLDASGNVVGNNRPDISGINPRTGRRHNIEVDSLQRTSDCHRITVTTNDPNAVNTFIVLP